MLKPYVELAYFPTPKFPKNETDFSYPVFCAFTVIERITAVKRMVIFLIILCTLYYVLSRTSLSIIQ